MSGVEKTLLIVEDDPAFGARLAQSMRARGFAPHIAGSVQSGITLAEAIKPRYALIDLRLGDGSGLDVVKSLRAAREDARIVVLTGYGNIATAVAAIKVGAVDYLAKPADPDAIASALNRAAEGAEAQLPQPPESPMSPDRVKWEHIQRIYHQCGGNISLTARQLNMHRRTLQRILQKYAPQE